MMKNAGTQLGILLVIMTTRGCDMLCIHSVGGGWDCASRVPAGEAA